MGATFSRLKNWTASETVTNTDLNAEFDNILNNLTPSGIDDYSTNVSQMQTQTDPGGVGSESLSTSIAGELERLRFVIKRLSGETYWYTAPDSSISELSSALGGGLPSNRIASGRSSANSSQAMFLVPHGTNRTVSIQGATTNLIYIINGTQYTISSNVTSGILTAAPSSSNTCLVNDSRLTGQTASKQMGEYDSVITVDNMGSEISALVGKLAAFKVGATEYFIAKVNSTTELNKVWRGSMFDSADSIYSRVALSDNDTITLMKLTWVFATTAGTIAVTYNNPRVSKDEPSSPSIGDYWFDLANNTWKYYDSSNWVSAGATLIGICMQDTSGTKAARSFDFFKNYNEINTTELERISATEIRGKKLHGQLNVFGTFLNWPYDVPRWDITADLDSGVTEAASTTYYLYIKESGDTVISNVPPVDRSSDIKGLYHPRDTWRCVGEFFNNSSSDISGVIDYITYDPYKFGVSAAVASNALTVTLTNVNTDPITHTAPVKMNFRSSTATSGLSTTRIVHYPISTTVSSGSTLGTADGKNHYLHTYALDNSSSIELAISRLKVADVGTLMTTTAEGGAGGADDGTVLYSTTARSNVPFKLLARLKSNQTTAGTWAANMTEISIVPFGTKSDQSSIRVSSGNGHGSSNTKYRRFSVIDESVGSSITYSDSSTDGASFTINEDGFYAGNYSDNRSGGSAQLAVSLNSGAGTTNPASISSISILGITGTPSGITAQVSWGPLLLKAGDVVNAHTSGDPDAVSSFCRFTIYKVDIAR